MLSDQISFTNFLNSTLTSSSLACKTRLNSLHLHIAYLTALMERYRPTPNVCDSFKRFNEVFVLLPEMYLVYCAIMELLNFLLHFGIWRKLLHLSLEWSMCMFREIIFDTSITENMCYPNSL